jgi:hypothetical protein
VRSLQTKPLTTGEDLLLIMMGVVFPQAFVKPPRKMGDVGDFTGLEQRVMLRFQRGLAFGPICLIEVCRFSYTEDIVGNVRKRTDRVHVQRDLGCHHSGQLRQR